MRVSVIVPVYNHQRFLAECLMSLHDQTWGDLELVVIDDDSADGSFAVAESFSKIPWVQARFSGLIVEKNSRNLGATDTINNAIAKSSGDVLMIANSDDRYHQQRVAACAEAVRNGSRFVFTGIRCINESGNDANTDEAADLAHAVAEISRYPSISLALLEKNRVISTGNICVTRELAEIVGPFRPLRYCHDWDFILAAILETEPSWIEAPYYEYRLHRSNTFRSLARFAEGDTRACFQRFFQMIDCRLIHNPTLRALVHEPALWEGILRRGGAVIHREWVASTSGINHRPVKVGSEPAEAPAREIRGAAPPAAATTVDTKVFGSRISNELFLTSIEGDVFPDGWIGQSATFGFWAGPGANRVIFEVYLGREQERRIVIFTLAAVAAPPREKMIVISPGEVTPVSFALESAAQAFTIAIRVPNAMSIGTDLRKLGVVVRQVSVGDASRPDAPVGERPKAKVN